MMLWQPLQAIGVVGKIASLIAFCAANKNSFQAQRFLMIVLCMPGSFYLGCTLGQRVRGWPSRTQAS